MPVEGRYRELIPPEEYEEGVRLQRTGAVRQEGNLTQGLLFTVHTQPPQQIFYGPGGPPRCRCAVFAERGCCRHLVAAALEAEKAGLLEDAERRRAEDVGRRALEALEETLPSEGTARLEVTLHRTQAEGGSAVSVSLRAGEQKLYVVRSIPELLHASAKGLDLAFGKGFAWDGARTRFERKSAGIADILSEVCDAAQAAGTLRDPKRLALPGATVRRLLDALRDTPFRVEREGTTVAVRRIRRARVPLHFRLDMRRAGLTVTALGPRELIPLTDDYAYVLSGETAVETEEDQRGILRALCPEMVRGRCALAYPMKESDTAAAELIPALKLVGTVEIAGSLRRRLVQEPLRARVYLDRDGDGVQARAAFCYGTAELDPFQPGSGRALLPDGRLLLRDAAGERRVLNCLDRAGFSVRRGVVHLHGADAVYDFVTGGLGKLRESCEVFLSNEFRRIAPRRPAFRGRAAVSGGRLVLEMTDGGKPSGEILSIMQALAQKRRYFRLKDGAFLDLTGLAGWEPLAEAVVEAAQQEGGGQSRDGAIVMRAYRAAWLDALLRERELPVEEDATFVHTARVLRGEEAEPVPLPPGLSLRPYQRRGYEWLSTLDRLSMGGVLADDMGLGKTIQMIALLKSVRAPGETSLVVAPTSLVYNWLTELERFAPELSAAVLSGSSAQRAGLIGHVRKAHDIDVLITSYPLIRRDIELMADMTFRVAVLDEAQQIKNAGSVSAAAVKRIEAHSRFALTGTPLENSIGEVWSIYDFVLPGYLGSFASFVRRYQEPEDLPDLRRKLDPFLLRRLKRDVLTELPDKQELVLTAQMTPEQEKVYRASMERLRSQVDRVLTEKGLQRGRIEVLAAITELRQICCHPGLVLDGYAGSSGKMELLMDILPGALESGRRVLLFSQFTSMLRILRRRLEAEGIRCMYLDGDTPSARRLEMCEQFNAGQAEVFLISLKAGGVGLNLTGADAVIHYDPWWNPAVEDQATDRAHRIGQTHKVDVIRLTTHGTVEEQVVELARRKRALFDQLITPGENRVLALSEQEIRDLFR